MKIYEKGKWVNLEGRGRGVNLGGAVNLGLREVGNSRRRGGKSRSKGKWVILRGGAVNLGGRRRKSRRVG